MRILVADDDLLYRKLLEASLRSWNQDVILASDGDQAWDAISDTSKPLLAILDWSMPGQDGLELCERIRSLPANRLVYVILLTARSSREDIIRGLESGADDYITKPCHHDELYARIQVGARMLRLQQNFRWRYICDGRRRPGKSQPTARALADVLLLQVHPQRSELLGAGGALHRWPF